jgi:hypothetical protein
MRTSSGLRTNTSFRPFSLTRVTFYRKLIKGASCSRVLYKLHHLCIRLRVTCVPLNCYASTIAGLPQVPLSGRGRVLDTGKAALAATVFDIAHGASHTGVSPGA